MQFFLREKIFSWRDLFVVMDGWQRPWFQCQADFTMFGHKLHLLNMGGYEVAYIEQKLLSMLPHYEIRSGKTGS